MSLKFASPACTANPRECTLLARVRPHTGLVERKRLRKAEPFVSLFRDWCQGDCAAGMTIFLRKLLILPMRVRIQICVLIDGIDYATKSVVCGCRLALKGQVPKVQQDGICPWPVLTCCALAECRY